MSEHKKIVYALIILLVLSAALTYYSKYNTRLKYTRTVFSEKVEEVFGFGKSAKKEIIYAREKFKPPEEETPQIIHRKPPTNATTTQKKLKVNKTFHGDGNTTTTLKKTHLPKQIQLPQDPWDSRFNNLNTIFNGSSELSCGSRKVFLVAVVGDNFLWEKKVKVLEDNTLSVDSSDDVTLWVKFSEDAGEDLYQKFQLNQSKSYIIPKTVEHWLSGDIKMYPIETAREIAFCVLSKD